MYGRPLKTDLHADFFPTPKEERNPHALQASRCWTLGFQIRVCEEGFALMAIEKKRQEIGLLWKRQENCWRNRCR